MIDFEDLAREKEDDFKELKNAAVGLFDQGELYREGLRRALKEAYKLGHYAGHCRGERCARESLGALEPRRMERF